MLAQISQNAPQSEVTAKMAVTPYTEEVLNDGGKVYWKGWVKVIGGASGWGGGTQSPGKEMLILTVSSNDPKGKEKQQPVSVPQFFALLNVLDVNGRKVNGDVSSLNCTGSRKGKDGKGGGEILGVKFGEVWMDASVSAVPKLNLSDYGTFTTQIVEKIESSNQQNIKGYEVQIKARMADVMRNGKNNEVSEEDKVQLRNIYKVLKDLETMVNSKKKELGIIEAIETLPF